MSDVGELLQEAIGLLTHAGRLGGIARVTVVDCLPSVIDQAEKFGRRVRACSDTQEWDCVQVMNGVVTFFGVRHDRADAETRSTTRMAPIDLDLVEEATKP